MNFGRYKDDKVIIFSKMFYVKNWRWVMFFLGGSGVASFEKNIYDFWIVFQGD